MPVVFMIEDDIKIVRETLAGNTKMFGLLVDKYQNAIFNLAFRMTRDASLAEDISQEAFLKAYRKLGSFDPDKKFFSWLYKIAVNEALNTLKRENEFLEYNDENNDPAEDDTAKERLNELSEKLKKAVNMLPPKYKVPIVLKHYEGLSYEEISVMLDIPVGKVKSRLYTARENLKLCLEKIK